MAENVNNKKVMSQIERMQEMMDYGLKTESKQYRSVEHERLGADGNMYGIIREGSKYHIKISDKKKPLKEDYEYIGGFQNHMDNQYDSYANALKHFDMKMTSLNEAYNTKNGSFDSWNVDGRNEIIAEASDKMKLEIARIREIMGNSNLIAEGKDGVCKDCKNEIEKKNINLGSASTGDAKNAGGDFYTEQPKGSDMENLSELEDSNLKGKQSPKVGNKKSVNEAVEENCEKECGSEITEDEEELDTEVDVEDGEGDDFETFDDEEFEINDEDLDDDGEFSDDEELETFDDEDEYFDDENAEEPAEGEDEIASLKAEISDLRSTIEAIADKLNVNEFDEDEPLYPDDEEEPEFDDESDVDYELEIDSDDEGFEDDEEGFESDEDGDFEEDEEVTVYESRAYRKAMMNEGKFKDAWEDFKGLVGIKDDEKNNKPNFANRKGWKEYDKKKNESKNAKDAMEETVLHDFGKHPRFKKEPFTYPNPTMSKTQGQWEAGDENSPSKGKKPYASTIGDPTPYGKNNKEITKTANSIAESIVKKLLKNR